MTKALSVRIMYIGTIESNVDKSICYQKWVDLVEQLDFLRSMEPRVGINPFTGKEVEFKPRKDIGLVYKGSDKVGSLDWAQDESNVLVVEAFESEVDYVIEIAEKVAEKINASFIYNPIYEDDA